MSRLLTPPQQLGPKLMNSSLQMNEINAHLKPGRVGSVLQELTSDNLNRQTTESSPEQRKAVRSQTICFFILHHCQQTFTTARPAL